MLEGVHIPATHSKVVMRIHEALRRVRLNIENCERIAKENGLSHERCTKHER